MHGINPTNLSSLLSPPRDLDSKACVTIGEKVGKGGTLCSGCSTSLSITFCGFTWVMFIRHQTDENGLKQGGAAWGVFITPILLENVS